MNPALAQAEDLAQVYAAEAMALERRGSLVLASAYRRAARRHADYAEALRAQLDQATVGDPNDPPTGTHWSTATFLP